MALGSSGPATVEEKSWDLWTGSKQKTVPCEAQCRAYLVGLEPPDQL